MRFKITTRILTAKSELCAFQNLQLEFLPQKSDSGQIFTAKDRVKIQNPSCAFQNLQLGLFRVARGYLLNGQVILFHWMGKQFHYALFESFAYNNAYYSACDRVIINYLIFTFCVERANES